MAQRFIAFVLFILTLPLYVILFLLIKFTSKGPFIFKQKRAGKNRRVFIMFKFRTMVNSAELLKHKYAKLNESDGPVFKIRNDPRFTKVGRYLAWSALDELPQLINVVKGEMAFVGPRPLPIQEADKVPLKYSKRFTVLPGLTSSWVIEGSHKLSFKQWMELDIKYIQSRSLSLDVAIIIKTVFFLIKSFTA